MSVSIQILKVEIEELKKKAAHQIKEIVFDNVETFRIKFLSRKGEIAILFEKLKEISVSEKPEAGKLLNELRNQITATFEKKLETLNQAKTESDNFVDVSLPGRTQKLGSLHPISQTMMEIEKIFYGMGFNSVVGPEIEDDFHNFTALNFPKNHPARDMQDTFFINEDILLRTHTTSVQIRAMELDKPPMRIIMPGRVYRNEAISSRSYCLFHQVDGVYIDKKVSMADLKGTLVSFAKQFYGSSIKYKIRPSYFPFTEPSLEMDITCFLCKGNGCKICKHSGWLEILGAGMIHPNVYKSVDINKNEWNGFAFGMGIERITLLRMGIDDIRMLYENDVRMLQQLA